MASEEELARRLADVETREAELNRRERVAAASGIRNNLYSRITLSRRTVDIIIIACAAAIVALTVVGRYMAKS